MTKLEIINLVLTALCFILAVPYFVFFGAFLVLGGIRKELRKEAEVDSLRARLEDLIK